MNNDDQNAINSLIVIAIILVLIFLFGCEGAEIISNTIGHSR